MIHRRLFTTTLLGAAILGLTVTTASAQYRFNPEHRRPVEATIQDLHMLNDRWHYHGDEEDRYHDAERHLHEFLDQLRDGGGFDVHQLDRAIEDTDKVLHHNHMHEEGRHLLGRDIGELRHLRDHYLDSYRYPY